MVRVRVRVRVGVRVLGWSGLGLLIGSRSGNKVGVLWSTVRVKVLG